MTSLATDGPVVHLVDDDESTRAATARLLRVAGHLVRTYASAVDFLSALPICAPGCAILDLQMPGLSGLDLQRILAQVEDPLPVVFLSGRADVPQSVEAMKAGAVDFITKTSGSDLLLRAVSAALARNTRERAERAQRRELLERYARLSPREREVFAHLIAGKLNKQVGYDLGISLQTTKVHRHRVFEKMRAASLVHLARMADRLGVPPIETTN